MGRWDERPLEGELGDRLSPGEPEPDEKSCVIEKDAASASFFIFKNTKCTSWREQEFRAQNSVSLLDFCRRI